MYASPLLETRQCSAMSLGTKPRHLTLTLTYNAFCVLDPTQVQ